MAEDFNIVPEGSQPSPKNPQPFSYQNLYDALKVQSGILPATVSMKNGQFFSTPTDLEKYLQVEKNQKEFFSEFGGSQNFKKFGISSYDQFKTKVQGDRMPWIPAGNVKVENTFGLPKFDPSAQLAKDQEEGRNKAINTFSKVAAAGLNVTPDGVELNTVDEFEEFKAVDPDKFEQWRKQNQKELLDRGLVLNREFDTRTEKKAVQPTQQEFPDAELTNTIATEYGLTDLQIGELSDNIAKDAAYRLEKEGDFNTKYTVGIEQVFATAQSLGYSEEKAFNFINRKRDAYRKQKFAELDLQKNQEAIESDFTLGAKEGNSYQFDMNKKGFEMLSEPLKKISQEYTKLDQLNAEKKAIEKTVSGFTNVDKLNEVNARIQQQKSVIEKLQKDEDIATGIIYDPTTRLPMDPAVTSAAFAKANQKYSKEYYNSNLLGAMVKERNILFNDVEDLRQMVLDQSAKIEKKVASGFGQPSQEELITLQSNQKLFAEKTAELSVLNKGIYTNSNPLKRQNASFTSGVEQYVAINTFGGLKKSSQALTYAEEAGNFAEFMQKNGYYVSEQDMEATRMSIGEQVGYGLLPTLGAMVEIGAYEAIGNQAGGVVAASRYFTKAKEFFKLRYGTNSTAVKAFEIFVEGGLKTAAKTGAYVAADQSAAGGLGEIASESLYEAGMSKVSMEKLLKGRNRALYVLGKYLSGAVGETLAEVSGGIADLMANEGYDFKKAFDLTTQEGQLEVIGITSLMLTAPGDIALLVKSKQKFTDYIAARQGQSIDPLILDMDRQLDAAIEQNKYQKSQPSPLVTDIEEPPVPAGPAPMSDAPIQEPGASEQEIPQEKVEETKKQEKLEVEKRVADIGEEFYVVEADGEIQKGATYRYDPKTGNLQSKGYSSFNESWQDVNSDLKAQVEQKVTDNGMLSSDKAKEIAKVNLGIEDDSKLIWKDGKLLYSRDTVNQLSERNATTVKNTASGVMGKIKQYRQKVDSDVFEGVDQVNTNDPQANAFANALRNAFGGKMRLDLGSFFLGGSKINTDGQKGMARVSNYMAPLIEKFNSMSTENTAMFNKVKAAVLSSDFFTKAFSTSDLNFLNGANLMSDAADTFIANLLINHESVLSEVFGDEQLQKNDLLAFRQSLNEFVAREYTGKETANNTYAFYNTKMKDVRAGLSKREMNMKAKEFVLAQQEKQQIQNISKTARGTEYKPEEVGAIRFLQGKIPAQDFLDIIGQDTTNLTEQQIQDIAKQKADALGVYDTFMDFKEKYESFASTRKERIKRLKTAAFDKAFDLKLYGTDAANPNDNPIVAAIKSKVTGPRKLRQQKNYAANLMNTMIEFAAIRSGLDPDVFLETMLSFEKIDQQTIVAGMSQVIQSNQGRIALQNTVKNDPELSSGRALDDKILAEEDLKNGVDPLTVYFARGWFQSKDGIWMYGDTHPAYPKLKEGVDIQPGVSTWGDVLEADALFELFPELENVKINLPVDFSFNSKPIEIRNNILNGIIRYEIKKQIGLKNLISEKELGPMLSQLMVPYENSNNQNVQKITDELIDEYRYTSFGYNTDELIEQLHEKIEPLLNKDKEAVLILSDIVNKLYAVKINFNFKRSDPKYKADPISYMKSNGFISSMESALELIYERPATYEEMQSNFGELVKNYKEALGKLRDADFKTKRDIIQLINATTPKGDLTAIQKENLLKLSERIENEYEIGKTTLNDFDILELGKDSKLYPLIKAFQDIEYNYLIEVSGSGMGIDFIARRDLGGEFSNSDIIYKEMVKLSNDLMPEELTLEDYMKDENKQKLFSELSKEGVVFHGGDQKIKSFDPDKVKGGVRANYGWGIYFTPVPYKASEYGKTVTFVDRNKLNSLNVNDRIPSGFVFEIKQALEENSIQNPYYDLFLSKLKDFEGMTLNEARLRMGDFIKWDYNKLWSQMFKDAGYDAFSVSENEYVVINPEKANSAIIKDPIEFIKNKRIGEKIPFKDQLTKKQEENKAIREQLLEELEEQVKLAKDTKSEEFKNWFGNSEVLDENGEPLDAFRGTAKLYGKENYGVLDHNAGDIGGAIYYSDLPTKAFSYLKDNSDARNNIRRAYLKIENPIVIDAKGNDWQNVSTVYNLFGKGSQNYNLTTRDLDILLLGLNDNDFEKLQNRFGLSPVELTNWVKTKVKDPNKAPDGVIIKNVVDYAQYGKVGRSQTPGNVYITYKNDQVLLKDYTLFQKDPGTIRAAVHLKDDGTAIIYAVTDPNVSSPLHEMAHVLENYLSDEEKQTVLDFAGETDWNTNASETFARGFERYLYEGVAPNNKLKAVFEKFKAWLTEIYTALGLGNLGKELNPQMKSIYNTIFGEGATEEKIEEEIDPQDKEIEDIINQQRAAGVSEQDIYYGLIKAGFTPQDVTEFFQARTKQTVAKILEKESNEFQGLARSIEQDAVTIQRTLGEVVSILNELSPTELNDLMSDLKDMENMDVALVALIQKIQEGLNAGTDVTSLFAQAVQTGTNAGRVLQRMKLLSQQQGQYKLYEAIKKYNKADRKIPTAKEKELKILAVDMDKKKAEYEQAKSEATLYPTQMNRNNPNMTNLEYAFVAQQNYDAARIAFYKALKPYARNSSFTDLYDTLVRGNLLTLGSQVINLTSSAIKTLINLPLNIVATGVGITRNQVNALRGKQSERVTYRGAGYYGSITSKYKQAFKEGWKAISQGSVVEDANGLQISRGFNGFRAFRDTFGMLYDYALSNMSEEEMATKYNYPLNKAGKIPTKDKILRAMEGTFGAVAEANFRLLGGPDAFFRTTAYFGALYEQGKVLGLSEEKKPSLNGMSEMEIFIKLNSDYSNQPAMDEAMRLIYANDGLLYKNVIQKFFGGVKKTYGSEDLGKSAVTTLVPYQKIPTNVAEEFVQFASPTVSFVASIYHMRKASELKDEIEKTRNPSTKKKLIEDRRKALRDSDMAMSRMLISIGLQYAATLIIENLAVSGSASPAAGVDEKERQWKKDFMPADQINVSLLMRNWGKKNKSKDWIKGDQTFDLRTFGVFGAILSMKKTEVETKNRSEEKINLSKINTEVGEGSVSMMGSALIFPYLLDQTMVKNLGDAFTAITEITKSGNINAFSDFAAGYFNTVVTAFAPNHLNTFTKFNREFESSYKATPDEKASMGFGELTVNTLSNRLKEKVPFYFDNNYLYQYDITGMPRRQTPKTLDSVFELMGVDVPRRDYRGISKDGGAFDYTKQIYEKINNSKKDLDWKDVIYLTFAYGNVKEVIPPDVPKSIETELFRVSLNKEEMDEFRNKRNFLRNEIIGSIFESDSDIFKQLLDLNGPENRNEDGSRITYGDKNQLLGYVIAGKMLGKIYSSVDNVIKETLGPVIVNKRLSELTPEEKAVIDKIKKENVLGDLIGEFYEDKDAISQLKEIVKSELLSEQPEQQGQQQMPEDEFGTTITDEIVD